MTDILSTLDSAQREAVTAIEGPVLVLAGPGSGKTRVLTHRIAYLVRDCGLDPYNIMAVTFTNKAAREMRERTERLLGGQLRGLTIGTFHSICVRLLRREAEAVGLPSNFVIYDEGDQLALARQALKDLNLDEKLYRPQAMLGAISKAKSELLLPDECPVQTYWQEVARRVYGRYQELLAANRALDFDDLLLRAARLLRDHADVRAQYQRRYVQILVDEFQDTNTVQYELVKLLAGGHRNLFVVGDEDQSIYRWRGADYRNVARFKEDYPDHRLILLEQNYRSTQTILDAANAVIAQNVHRHPKRLYTEKGKGPRVTVFEAYNEQEEGSYVAETIARLVESGNYRPGDFAVMYRTNAQSRPVEEAFLARGMRYKLVGATRFYDRKEIKDAIAYLRLVHNPNDAVSLERVINVPPRGIGAKTVTDLVAWAGENGWTAWEALQQIHEALGEPEKDKRKTLPFASKARYALADFARLLANWRELRHEVSVAALLGRVLEESGYAAWIRDGTDEGEERWQNLQELLTVASEYNALSSETALTTFLEEVALVSDVDNLAENHDAPTLLTLHMAKGLEFPVVFITGLEEGILPHSRSQDDPEEMEEERRLCYVGITRAKERLYLIYAFRRTRWGTSDVSEPSRFLQDIPPHLIEGRAASQGTTLHRQATREAAIRRETAWAREASPARSPSPLPFVAGDRVNHAIFGAGTVIAVTPVGDDAEVQVAFQGRGVKRLLASLAKLEKVTR
jgi:DNA helicase-2/ATP-dependent DNA helicase PcrA